MASRISTTREAFSSTTPIAIWEPEFTSAKNSSATMTTAMKYCGPSIAAGSSMKLRVGAEDCTAAATTPGSPPRAVIWSLRAVVCAADVTACTIDWFEPDWNSRSRSPGSPERNASISSASSAASAAALSATVLVSMSTPRASPAAARAGSISASSLVSPSCWLAASSISWFTK